MLGPVAGRVEDTDLDRADLQHLAVLEWIEGKLRSSERMNRNRQVVLEHETPVPREVIRMCVRLEHADDTHAVLRGGFQVLLDRERRVDHDRLARVTDEVRPASQVVVDELTKDHGSLRCRAITMRCTSFVPSPISRIFWSRYRREIAYSSMKPHPPWICRRASR